MQIKIEAPQPPAGSRIKRVCSAPNILVPENVAISNYCQYDHL